MHCLLLENTLYPGHYLLYPELNQLIQKLVSKAKLI